MADTAAKTGRSASVVAEEVKLAGDIAPDVKEAIRGTGIANKKTALVGLSKLPPDEQRKTVASSNPKAAIKRSAKRTQKTSAKARVDAAPELPKNVRLNIDRLAALLSENDDLVAKKKKLAAGRRGKDFVWDLPEKERKHFNAIVAELSKMPARIESAARAVVATSKKTSNTPSTKIPSRSGPALSP